MLRGSRSPSLPARSSCTGFDRWMMRMVLSSSSKNSAPKNTTVQPMLIRRMFSPNVASPPMSRMSTSCRSLENTPAATRPKNSAMAAVYSDSQKST